MAVDRRALIRKYKDTPRPMGVGLVRNLATGRTLLFGATELPSLLNRHRAQLRLGAHPLKSLQADWQDLGEGRFEFAVVDTLQPKDEPGYDPTSDLRELLALWREKLAATTPLWY